MIDKFHFISQSIAGSHLTAIQEALDAGCRWIQLRIKNERPDFILEQALAANTLCQTYGAKLIVNDHPEIALKAGAYGVHLGLQDMSVNQARKIVGPDIIIGGTANTFAHVLQHVNAGVDYIGCGPFRFTRTKENLSPILGLNGLETLVQQTRAAGISIPIIAIGGILSEDVGPLLFAGLYGVAMSGAVTFTTDRRAVVQQTYQKLNEIPCLK